MAYRSFSKLAATRRVLRARRAALIALLAAGFSLWGGASLAERASSSKGNARAEALTQQLVSLGARHRNAVRAVKPAILDELISAAPARQQILAALIEDDPAQVLRVALPRELRASLPDAVRSYLEARVSVEGEFEAVYEDSEHASRLRHFLKARGERFSLHFVSDPPDLPSGARIRVEGVDVDGALALGSGQTSVETLELAAEPAFDEKQVLVLLVNFSNNPTAEPYTVDEATETVFGTTSDFMLENSFGQTWLSGEVYGWYTLPIATTCSGFQIASAADAAAGIDPSGYDSVIYVFPKNISCGWSGMATVGGSPGKIWINGSLQLQVVGHELGHNFGLHHSHGLECGDARTGSDCQTVEYGDRLDMMGLSRGHLGAFQKERLAWLGDGAAFSIANVESEGTYLLDAYEAEPGSGPKALKVLKSIDSVTGKRTWYYVEYRQAIGFDGFLASYANVLNGVVIRTASEASANSSFLLDMTPGTYRGSTDFKDPALEVGESFSSPDGDLTITTQWADGDQAAVSVAIASQPCAHADPTIALSPSEAAWVEAGARVIFTALVTNHDDASCAASQFELTPSVPAGWTAALDVSSITLLPGSSSAGVTLEVTSPATTPDGFYTVGLTARHGADTGRVATASATYVVTSDAANGPPVPVDDGGSVLQGASLTLDVLANDWDPENDALELIEITQGSRGSVVINADSTVTYTARSNARGGDSFQYTITDGASHATGVVSIRVEKQSRERQIGKKNK
jgi:hypothetical protein